MAQRGRAGGRNADVERQGHAPGGQHLAAPGQRVPALRVRPLGSAMAEDFIVGFQYREEAERFLTELRERLAKFGLELHPEKTRLLEFGPFAAEHRRRADEGKPETFDFLGFTHICGKKRNGRFTVVRQTIRKRLQAKLSEVKAEMRRRLHGPIPEVGAWLRAVIIGHLKYYGVPMNRPALFTFCSQVRWLWYRALRRRSQTARLTWART